MATAEHPQHDATPCFKLGGVHLQYHNKSYSDAFQCPRCGAQRRFNLNFLGGRRVPMCDGKEIKAGDRLDFATFTERRTLAQELRSQPQEKPAHGR